VLWAWPHRSVIDDGSDLPGGLNLSDSVAESLESLSSLGGADVDVKAVHQFVTCLINPATAQIQSASHQALLRKPHVSHPVQTPDRT
jgi:hypothetical protein